MRCFRQRIRRGDKETEDGRECRRQERNRGAAGFEVDGYTPLHLSAWQGHAEAARALMVAGADKEAKDK
eukprot:1474709-Rhodomonas_salina.1